MSRLFLAASAAIVALACFACSDGAQETPKPDGFKEITFDSSDHRKVFADFYPAEDPNSEKVILMFHQAGSNAAEYETMEPVAAKLGYNCISVDLRAGGDMWGKSNRTESTSGVGGYMEAYNDMQGAFDYAQSKNYTTIVAWGSSYSSSLTMKLADDNASIKAVLLFSPGEYFDDKGAAKTWAEKLSVPVLFACTNDEWSDGRKELFNAISSDSKTKAVFDGGIHGASTLRPDKSPAADKYIDAVKQFLASLPGGR